MAQTFSEVFPGIGLNQELQLMMSAVTVDKLVMTESHSLLKVYITCDSLIEKRVITQVEKELARQLSAMSGGGMKETKVRFFETYHLSSQYDLKTLFDRYLESILYELKTYSPVMHVMLKNATLTFPAPGEVTVDIEESALYRQKEAELLRILEKIVCIRCGIQAEFTVIYHERETERESAAEKEAVIRRKVALICANADSEHGGDADVEGALVPWEEEGSGAESGALSAEKPEGAKPASDPGNIAKAKETAAPKTSKTKSGGSGFSGSYGGGSFGKKGTQRRSFQKRGFRNPDDPDYIMGHNTDGAVELIEHLSEGGIQSVVVRGQIWGVNEDLKIGDSKTLVSFYITDFTDSVKVKIFCPNEELQQLMKDLKPDGFFYVAGRADYDAFDHEVT
ncbi:MAG: hypothetical protein K6E18_04535, partial [Lachnospiraceae bacterium]|nr:hypothetical protein [Lachnospiraceae bacterium]